MRGVVISTDVLVIGSGAGGLSAAVTAAAHGLKVVVAERAPLVGGSSCWSGGWLWLPRNRHARQGGIDEPAEAPRRYLEEVLGDRFDAARVDAFLAAAPELVDFFEANSALRFEPGNHICDIYGELPGAGTGGRSLIAAPYDARALGHLLPMLRPPMPETAFWGMPIQAGSDLAAFMSMTRSPRSFLHVARRMARHLRDLALHGRAMQLVNGIALVARLLRSAADLGVTFLTDAPATRLLASDGRVRGAILSHGGEELRVEASRGVVLATGGFPHDVARRADLFPHSAGGPAHWSVATPEADGAGIALAEAVGARIDLDVAAPGAWCPVSLVPYPDGSVGHFPHIIDRGKPGAIAVRRDGRRFVNEANGYHDYVAALFDATPAGEAAESWIVADHRFQRRYGLGISRPAPVPNRRWLRNGYLKRAATLAGLARACGIDPQGLEATVGHFNEGAAIGQDPAFLRGSTPYNRYQGDQAVGPNPSLRAIGPGPYYAVRVVPGSFGTFAGIAADHRARVLAVDGAPLGGLYAAGSDAASVMGGYYPAGGINLGPGVAWGYIAGRDCAGR